MNKVQRTVLLVEDGKADRLIVGRALRQDPNFDYHLIEAESGAQALACLRQQQPDCLLLDYQLPDTDGLTLLQTVVQQAAPHIYPVIMLTGMSSTPLVVQALQQGAHDFLPKAALTAERLQWAIHQAIDKVALQRQLEEQREWFRLTLASIGDAVITTDRDGNVTFMNPVAETLTGWTLGAAQGQHLAQIFCIVEEATHQPVADPVSAVLRTNQGIGSPNHTARAGPRGRQLFINYNATPIHDRVGQVSGVVLTFRDVSAHGAAAEQLRQANDRFERAERAANGFVFESNLRSDQVTRSPNFTQITGYAQDEVAPTAAGWLALIHPEDLAHFSAQDLLSSSATTYSSSYRVRHKAGHYIWVQEQGLIERDETGRPLAIIGTTLDSTARQQAEAALRASEERFRAIADYTYDWESWVGADGRPLWINPAVVRLTGWTADECLQMPDYPLPLIHPADRAAMAAHLQSALAGSTANHVTFRIRHRAGHEVWAAISWQPILNQGVRQGYRGSVRDITERKAAEEALRQIADNVPGLIAYIGADERYHFVNSTYEQWFQRPHQQIVGHTIRELVGEEVYQKHRYREQALAGESVTFEEQFHYPDGVRRSVWGRYHPHCAADGTVLGFYLFAMDISERKQAEADAHFLAALAEIIRLADDAEALMWLVSQQVGDYLQVGRSHFIEVDQANDRAIIHRDYCRGVPSVAGEFRLSAYNRATWGELAAGRTLINHDTQHDPRTAAIYAPIYHPAQEGAGVAVPLHHNGEWHGIFSVTTPDARHWQPREVHLLETSAERVWLAVEKLRLDAELRRSNAILSGVLESNSDAIFVRDRHGRYLLANRMAAAQVQINQEAIIGKHYAELFTPAEVAAIRQDDDPVLRQGLSVSLEHTTTHDGITRYWHTLKMPLRNAEGEIIGLISSGRDITGHKRAELHQHFLSALFMQLRLLSDTDAMLAQLVANLGQHLGVSSCRINAIDLRHEVFTVQKNWGDGDVVSGSPYPLTELAPPAIVTALRTGKTVAVANIATDPRTAAVADEYSDDEIIAFIGVPIFHEGAWRATLSVKSTGERHWHSDEVNLLETVANQFSALLEKVRTEEALRRSEARYRTIFENVGVSLWEEDFSLVKRAVDELTAGWRAAGVTDLGAAMHDYCTAHPDFMQSMLKQVRILDVNEETVRLYGVSKAQLLQPFAQFFTPATLARFRNELALIASGGERYTFDGPIQTPQGETRHLAFTVVFPPEAGGLLDRVLVSGLDVTALKQAEAALRASEERLRLALAGGSMGIWEWHVTTGESIWNEPEYALFGLAPGTALTGKLFDQLLHPADREAHQRMLDHLVVQGSEHTGEFRIMCPDGTMRWLAERCIVIRDAQGRAVRLLGINFDITDRKAQEAALRQVNSTLEQRVAERTRQLEQKNIELERSNKELEKFAYVASHDLRSPLRAIDNLAKWIEEDAGHLLPDASKEHLAKMRGRVRRMDKLLDDLLAYSRIGRFHYSTEKVKVKDLLQEIVALLNTPSTFQVTIPEALPIFRTQRVPLELVLRNLIGNAIKHHHRPDGHVQVAAHELGEWIEFVVSDDGPGIAPQYHSKIFEIFQTLKPRDQVEGSGMGLAIVKKAIELVGGAITVESNEGAGATFRFTWPKLSA